MSGWAEFKYYKKVPIANWSTYYHTPMLFRTLGADEVPYEFREVGIISGYRPPNTSARDCLRSLFSLHNETFNVWTHVISLALFIQYTYNLSEQIDFFKQENEAILCLLLGAMAFTLGSSIAHLFNCMSDTIRNICFMVDYLGISIYAFSACQANKVYTFPSSWRGGHLENWFVSVMFLVCALTVGLTCYTRFMPRTKLTKLIRLSCFGLPYLVGMSPCLFRVFYCHMDLSCDAATFYQQHFTTNVFTVLFYAGHFPEIVFPGYFDVFFQGHSIFHVVAAFATYYHAQGIVKDSILKPSTSRSLLAIPALVYLGIFSLLSCLIVFIFAMNFSKWNNSKKSKSQ